MRKFIKVIDFANEWMGRGEAWLVVVLAALISGEVILRYVFRAPTVWGFETSCMLGGTIAILAAGYVQLHQGHVRVDILYERLSIRGKAILDLIGHVIICFPICGAFIVVATSWMLESWRRGEVMVETYWYPPAFPFRVVVVIGFCLLLLQFIAQFARDLHVFRKGIPYD